MSEIFVDASCNLAESGTWLSQILALNFMMKRLRTNLFSDRFDLLALDIHLRPDILRHGQERGYVFPNTIQVRRNLLLAYVIQAHHGEGRCFINAESLQGDITCNLFPGLQIFVVSPSPNSV